MAVLKRSTHLFHDSCHRAMSFSVSTRNQWNSGSSPTAAVDKPLGGAAPSAGWLARASRDVPLSLCIVNETQILADRLLRFWIRCIHIQQLQG